MDGARLSVAQWSYFIGIPIIETWKRHGLETGLSETLAVIDIIKEIQFEFCNPSFLLLHLILCLYFKLFSSFL